MGHAMERNSELPRLRPVEMEGLILRCLSSIGQKIVADAIGVDESTLSRWNMSQATRKGRIFDDVMRHAQLWAEKNALPNERKGRQRGANRSQPTLF